MIDAGVRGILLDIEGTTTPIAFVHDVLFSYARAHASDFLTNNIGSDEVRADVSMLFEEHALDVVNDRNPPELTEELESLATYIEWLIDQDRKSTGLKSLQGKIWRQGYLDGSLKSQVFEDVAPAFERWRAAGLKVSIFSSGSVLAQQLLFAHTNAGDLTRFIDGYFDTNTGKKGEAESYRRIAAEMGLEPSEIVFISDVVDELDAAEEAGMKTLLSVRPGNQIQGVTHHQAIESIDQL
ncbi:MAG TPA: acireductone synthase [Pyrinomonadaceae bacterium]|nr:acireductone synthase [Pyrinomonadaceae bacterium]